MKIAIGSDHGGYELKEVIKEYLMDNGEVVIDYGTLSGEKIDYPDKAVEVCNSVLSGESKFGILVCGTGIGMSMTANKVKGIRAALLTDSYSAKMAKEHNNANIICFGGRVTGSELALHMIRSYMEADFGGGRHVARIEKIMKQDMPL